MQELAEKKASGARRLVLGFDAGCFTCSELAQRIEDRVGEKLEVRSLDDPQMVHWRSKALGEDAPWAPTLVEVRGGEVKAWTGVKMGARLSISLGPVVTWRVMQVPGDMNAAPAGGATVAAVAGGLSRGQFLKGVGGAAVAMSILASTGKVASAAQSPSGSSGTRAQQELAKSIVRSSAQLKQLLKKVSVDFGSATV